MVYGFARLLQLCGLVILPVAVMGNVAYGLDLRESLMWSAVGIGTFYLGWLIQQSVKPK